MAEIRLGSETGDLKYEFVVNKVYSLLPFYVKIFVNEKLLDIWIETAVDELQEMLDKEIKRRKPPSEIGWLFSIWSNIIKQIINFKILEKKRGIFMAKFMQIIDVNSAGSEVVLHQNLTQII